MSDGYATKKCEACGKKNAQHATWLTDPSKCKPRYLCSECVNVAVWGGETDRLARMQMSESNRTSVFNPIPYTDPTAHESC